MKMKFKIILDLRKKQHDSEYLFTFEYLMGCEGSRRPVGADFFPSGGF